MDFNDLARSGTAPEPSKVKVNQMTGPTLSLRPKTRGADNDMQDFRIELRTNKVGYQQKTYSIDTGYDNGEEQSDEFIRAMESYQADFESWSRGRTDFDASGPPTGSNTRQSTASSGQRPTASGKKVQNSALSAYTQNVPQILLQTSKKTKVVPSPRSREPKADVRADIRAAYGADFLERQNIPLQRPKSQKPPSQPQSPSVSKGSADTSLDREEYSSDTRPQSGGEVPSSMTGRSSSASRLRANISQQNPYNVDAPLPGAAKPFSVRKAAPSTSSGPRQTTRPFSHSEGVRTSVSQGTTAGTAPRASLDTPTSSSSSKRVARKSATPGIAPSPLLKSSLAPSSTRGTSGRAERPSSNGSDLTKSDHDDRDFPVDDSGSEYYQIAATNYEVIERSAKQRAATADLNTRKAHNDSGAGYSYTQSAGTAGVVNKNGSSTSDSRDGIAASHSSGRTPTKDTSTRRGYSQSPTLNMDGLNLGKSDSEQAFLGIIQDTDNLECSFDESPILAAYLQQKSLNSHTVAQEAPAADSSTRPQSRKLYLGAEKETATSVSPKEGKSSYKTAPRSAGARYPAPHAPVNTTSTSSSAASGSMDGPAPPLRKMSSFNEVIPQSRKWHEIPPSNLPDLRPPSRQSSAFPVHLADEPSNGTSLRLDDSKIGKTATSPTAKGITSPPAVSSMRWNRNGGDDDEDEGEIEEALHQDDALSEASSVDEAPIKFRSSGKSTTPVRETASPSHNLGASSQSVVPARTHIGIMRNTPVEERPDTSGGDLYTPEFAIQRPPSRQKIAAQHLFEGGPPPSRVGTEKDTSRSSRAATAADPSGESLPMSRSNTRPSTTHYNPRDDGFTDLDTNEAAAVPFVIKFNNSDSLDFEEFDLDDLALGHSRSQQAHHERDRDLPRRKSQNTGPGHSRTGSGASNTWAEFSDDGPHNALSPGYRPQTMGGSVKAPRLLGVIPPGTHAAPPPRTKSAGDGLKSPGVPLRREGNNFLLAQQPHAPLGGPMQSRGPGVGSGRAANSISGWTEASNSSSPRSQNVKIVETPLQHVDASGSGILQMRSVSHSPSALKLNEHSLASGNNGGSRSRDDDFLDMDSDDDITIMTEDSGRHMESGMSMHSLALDSSLGEDFLSLFAPGPP